MEEVTKKSDITKSLRNFNSPVKLIQSSWIKSCLVSQFQKEYPHKTNVQSVKAVFKEVLDLVAAENSEYADLLHGRYWEGLSVGEMVAKGRPHDQEERSFYYQQKNAVTRFIQILWEREQMCRRLIVPTAQDSVTTLESVDISNAYLNSNPVHLVLPLEEPLSDQVEAFLVGEKSTAASNLRIEIDINKPFQYTVLEDHPSTENQSPSLISGATKSSLIQPTQLESQVNLTIIFLVVATIAFAFLGVVVFSLNVDRRSLPSAIVLVSLTPPQISMCGEVTRLPTPAVLPFVPSQGVTAFSMTGTNGAIINNKIRSITVDDRGLWIGYFATPQNSASGLGQYDKKSWAQCESVDGPLNQNINAMAVDQQNNLWLATEKAGVMRWDGHIWSKYTVNDGLSSNETFGITIDKENNVWVATWQGISKFDGFRWTVPYTVEGETIASNHTHTVVFDASKNMWVGHMGAGVSYYNSKENKWFQYTTENSGIGGNRVHSIVVSKDSDGISESVWFGTADGGVSKLTNGAWTVYQVRDGLPSNEVRAVAVDHFNRIWAATSSGVVYFDGLHWKVYHTLDAFSIAFGVPNCSSCPFDEDHVWTSTADYGVTHSRIPYNEDAIDVVDIRYPKVVAPGQKFRVEVVVIPRSGYSLRESKGDALKHIDLEPDLRFGSYMQMAVKGVAEAGQRYTFTDYENLFHAPLLAEGERERTFTSTWRVWMFTRYVGPPIKIVFTVSRGAYTPISK